MIEEVWSFDSDISGLKINKNIFISQAKSKKTINYGRRQR